MAGYTELQVCSNYSFLRGASRIKELMLQAKALGYDAVAVTDHNTLAEIARAHARAREVGFRLVVGCRLELTDGLPVHHRSVGAEGAQDILALFAEFLPDDTARR